MSKPIQITEKGPMLLHKEEKPSQPKQKTSEESPKEEKKDES